MLGLGTTSCALALQLGVRLVCLCDPELRRVQVATGSFQHALRLQPLLVFRCALGGLLGFADRLPRPVSRLDRGVLIGCTLRKRGNDARNPDTAAVCVRSWSTSA
jgi:hypothetical protein